MSASAFLISKINNLKEFIRNHELYEVIYQGQTLEDRLMWYLWFNKEMEAPEIIRTFDKWLQKEFRSENPLVMEVNSSTSKDSFLLWNISERDARLEKLIPENCDEGILMPKLKEASLRILGYMNLMWDYKKQIDKTD